MEYRREIVSVSKTVPPSLREYLFPLGGQLRYIGRVTEEAGDFNTITLPLIHMTELLGLVFIADGLLNFSNNSKENLLNELYCEISWQKKR